MKNNSNNILNIMPYVFIGAIVIVCLFTFNIIPSPFNNSSSDISFTEKTIRLKKNNGVQLSLSGDNSNVKYKSSDEKIVTVNEFTGYVTGINNGTATIIASVNGKEIDSCTVEVYTTSNNTVNIESLSLNETNTSMYVGDTKQLSVKINPSNASGTITWSSSNTNVATVNNSGLVTAKGVGSTIIKVSSNNGKYITCNINVTKKSSSTPSTSNKPITKLVISSNKLSVTIGETKKITYRIEPTDGTIKSIKWESADPSVATVDSSGNVKGIKEGGTEVTLNINNNLIGKISISVKSKITGINLKSSGSVSLKVGNTSQISAETIPSNSGVTITYKSNNGNVTVSNTGLIKGVSAGSSVITLTAGNYTKTVNVTVTKDSTPEQTVVTSGVWGYSDSRTVNPVRAGNNFFTGLANKGIGSMSGNIYTYSGYTYDTSKSNLTYGGRTSLIRIYYPNGVDLSSVNTFAIFGGTSERNMGGMFSAIDKNTSMIKSSGIIILVSTTGSYNKQDAINATNFVKAITKQKSGVKNSVGGYSLGGPAAGGAMKIGNYDRLFILHSKVELTDTASLKGKKIYVYSPKGDKLSDSTRTTLVSFKNNGAGKNLTLVTNNSEFIKTFGNIFTIVNPGSAQGSGHGYANFVNGNVFAFACS